MFITGKEILDQTERWKGKIPDTLPIKDPQEINDTVKALSATSKTSPEIDSILIYPYPKAAGSGEEPQGISRTKGGLCELTLGDQVFLASEEVPRNLRGAKDPYREPAPYCVIRPGDFAVLITQEYIYLPSNIIGLISMRNRYKQRGLINVSGFHVDAGFHGRLIFTAYNAGPTDIVLKLGEHLFMIAFAKLTSPVIPYGQGPLEIPVESISALKGVSVSPKSLDQRVTRLEIIVTVLAVPLAIALIAALLRVI